MTAVDAAGPAGGDIYTAPLDWYTPTLDSDPDGDLVITHTHEDGTHFDGGSKGDGTYEIVLTHRFTWRRGVGVHIPNSRDRFADLVSIDKAAKALRAAGHTVAVTIDDLWRPAAVREDARADRAAVRADRLAERSERKAGVASAYRTAERSIADGMPFGEPVKIGHHSERRHRRAFERMDQYRRAMYDAADYADHLAARARAAAGNEAHKQSPRPIMRRIETLRAELRGWERELADPGTGDGRRRRAALEAEKIREDIAWQEHKLAAMGEAGTFVPWGPEHFRSGDWANVGGRWCQVARVNRKSVSVRARFQWMSYDQTGTVTWDEIHGRRRDGQQWDTPHGEPWPVEQAKRVARWERLARLSTVTGTPDEERRNVEHARFIARGLPITATDAELAAFPDPDDTAGRRELALLCLDIFDRLTAGERVPDVIAAITPYAGGEPVWRMPDGPTVDKPAGDLTPGDIIAGVYDSMFGGGPRLVRSMVGPVEHVGPRVDRRESGEWHTIRVNGQEHEVRAFRRFAVHPAARVLPAAPAAEAAEPAGDNQAPPITDEERANDRAEMLAELIADAALHGPGPLSGWAGVDILDGGR